MLVALRCGRTSPGPAKGKKGQTRMLNLFNRRPEAQLAAIVDAGRDGLAPDHPLYRLRMVTSAHFIAEGPTSHVGRTLRAIDEELTAILFPGANAVDFNG